jgi:DNA-binding PadR family transcriptional regulator
VYRAFEALTQAGLIEPMETNREGKRPERTVYQITADGREELETWLSELLEILLFDHSTFGAAVNYLCYISADVAINALQGRVVHLEGEIAALRATLRSLRGQMGLPRLFVLKPEYDLALREAELAWVQALLSDLRSGTLAWDPARLGRVFEEKRSDAD